MGVAVGSNAVPVESMLVFGAEVEGGKLARDAGAAQAVNVTTSNRVVSSLVK